MQRRRYSGITSLTRPRDDRERSELVSLVCSGESLEKAIALTVLGVREVPEFYGRYEKVHVFYGENLPKVTDGGRVQGTLLAAVHYLGGADLLPLRQPSDIWDERVELLERLRSGGRISTRMAASIANDEARCKAILANTPWHVVYPEARDQLLARARHLVPNVTFHPLDLRDSGEVALHSLPIHARSARVFTLNPDGFIKSSPIGGHDQLRHGVLQRIKHSVATSGNVYVFVAEAVRQGLICAPDAAVGFRELGNPPRRSYDDALELVGDRVASMVNEPLFRGFARAWRKVLDRPEHEQPTAAVYQALDDAGLASVNGLTTVLDR